MIDFHTLTLPSGPHYYLVCPAQACQGKAQALSPQFAVPVAELAVTVKTVLLSHPRITVVSYDATKNTWHLVQRTRILRFPDDIWIQLQPIDADHSTILIYSVSRYGYYDFRVNRQRVKSWLKLLELATQQM